MMLFFYNLIVYYNVFLTKPLPDFFSEMEKINPFLCNIDKNTVNYLNLYFIQIVLVYYKYFHMKLYK